MEDWCEENEVVEKTKLSNPAMREFMVLYPSINFYVSLEIPRRLSSYVSARSDLFGDGNYTSFGKTNTVKDSACPNYIHPFKAIYYVGVNDHQKILFEIFDNDEMCLGDGYLFASVEVLVADILTSPRIPLKRGEYMLGYLILRFSSLELHAENSFLVKSITFNAALPF